MGTKFREPLARAAMTAELGKIGVSAVDLLKAADSNELPVQRKARAELRRGLNALQDRAKSVLKDADDGTGGPGAQAESLLLAIEAAADLGNFLGARLDHAGTAADEGAWLDDSGRAVPVLRKGSDFRAHYMAHSSAGTSASSGNEQLQIGDFLRGVAGMAASPGVRAALSVGTDSAGGHLVPGVIMPQVLEALVAASSLLQAGAGIVTLDQGAKSFTTAAIQNIPTAAWRNENGNVTESDPTFRAVVAAPKSLAFYFKVSRELLHDAVNLSDALYGAIGQAFAVELDRVGLRGTGSAPEPRGILNTSGIQALGNGTNGAALSSYANLFSAAQALLQASAPMPTAAIMSPRSLVKLGGLVDSTGQPLRVPSMLEKVALAATPQIPNNLTVGASTDCSEIYVGDFTKVMFMMREQMSVQVLNEAFATTGQIGFLCHVRADLAVMYPAAFAVVTGVRP